MVVMAISALVIPTLYMAIVSGFRQNQSQDAALVAESELQDVADLLAQDIRDSWPSDKIWSDPHRSLSLEYLDERGELVRIFWYADGSSLVRIVMYADSGKTVFKEEMLREVKVDEVFRYWRGDGEQIKEKLASCATRVTVDLRSVANDSDVSATFDVAYRLRNPEVEPC